MTAYYVTMKFLLIQKIFSSNLIKYPGVIYYHIQKVCEYERLCFYGIGKDFISDGCLSVFVENLSLGSFLIHFDNNINDKLTNLKKNA